MKSTNNTLWIFRSLNEKYFTLLNGDMDMGCYNNF